MRNQPINIGYIAIEVSSTIHLVACTVADASLV